VKILIIFLLSTTGIEEVKFKTNGLNCSELAMAWTEVNTTYYNMRDGNPKLQGNYTKDGKLLVGWIC
tara:strand:+ start:227 stop:427 length:201 start_codon:yes stop_codon:yes gene_type:complete